MTTVALVWDVPCRIQWLITRLACWSSMWDGGFIIISIIIFLTLLVSPSSCIACGRRSADFASCAGVQATNGCDESLPTADATSTTSPPRTTKEDRPAETLVPDKLPPSNPADSASATSLPANRSEDRPAETLGPNLLTPPNPGDSASTTTPAPNPDKDQPAKTLGPDQVSRSYPASPASTLGPTTPAGSESRHKPDARSWMTPVGEGAEKQKQESQPPAPKSPGEGTARMDQAALPLAGKPPGEGMTRMNLGRSRHAGRVAPACALCRITAEQILRTTTEGSQKAKLKECSKCRSVRYCGKPCQLADWPAHKATCKRLQGARG
jgi:hypothetical protein